MLCEDDFNVELFGVDLLADELPNNYQIVDYGSRETMLVCEDGEIIDDADEIAGIIERKIERSMQRTHDHIKELEEEAKHDGSF